MTTSEQATALIDELERLLVERYNAPLEGELGDAVDALRTSPDAESLAGLSALLADRELFRWREPVDATATALGSELEKPTKTSRK